MLDGYVHFDGACEALCWLDNLVIPRFLVFYFVVSISLRLLISYFLMAIFIFF
jgi:hypothetical protein